MRRAPVRLSVLAGALALAAPAFATMAYVCHPDPAGTRTLALHDPVVSYAVSGDRVLVALGKGAACRPVAWTPASGSIAFASSSCAAVTAASRAAAAPSVRLVVPRAGIDRPQRLAVVDPRTGKVLRSWPLPVRVRPGTLRVSGSFASFSGRGAAGLYVTRLSDGRSTLVGPTQPGDRPQLTPQGVVYEDDLYKRDDGKGRTLLKFVPTRGIAHELSRVGRPLHTGGVIRSFAMDGSRVALAIAGGPGQCDRVVFWDIPWRSVEQVSQKAGPTCASLAASGRISQVALGGARAQWVTMQRGKPMLVAADDIGCQEWVIRRAIGSVGGISADGPTLAFAVLGRTATIGRVTSGYRGGTLATGGAPARAVSADSGRIATLRTDGTVDVRTAGGVALRVLRTPGAASIALRRNTVAVTTSAGRLDVYSVTTGARIHSWRLPAGAAPAVDLQYGIAVVTAGRTAYAVNVSSGRTAPVAVAPASVRAQIESIGIVYVYADGTRGMARLVPMSRVEAAVR